MTETAFDLEAYLARISLAAPVPPTLDGLRAVIAAHTAVIPFENVDVLLGRGVRFDVAAVQDKLVRGRRGGYCFEQNALLRAALTALGFRPVALLARVVRGQAPDADTPRTHMMLRVDLPQGPYLADVGFGNLTPTAPLGFGVAGAQPTGHEDFRLTPLGDAVVVEALVGEAWQALYRVPPDVPPAIDLEVGNWFTATHPASPFTGNLIVARPGPGVRRTLFNTRLAERPMAGAARLRVLADAADGRAVLAGTFGLELPDETMRAVLAALPGEAAARFGHFLT